MQSRVATTLLSVPFAVAGWLTAHSLAYMLAAPDSHHREALLSETGHGYLVLEPFFVACGFVLVVAGLLTSITEGIRDRPSSRPSVRLLTLMPVLGFAVIEHVERLIAHGAVPYGLALESTFLAGLALQLPLAVAALGFTHALHRLGRSVGYVLAGWARPVPPLAPAGSLAVIRFIPGCARPLPADRMPAQGPRAPPSSPGP